MPILVSSPTEGLIRAILRLLCIAVDASYMPMWSPATAWHYSESLEGIFRSFLAYISHQLVYLECLIRDDSAREVAHRNDPD